RSRASAWPRGCRPCSPASSRSPEAPTEEHAMAGITGWIDFERDVARDVDTVRAMTATLASRGPDGEELWASPRAVLGHRRLALRPGADDRQPLVVDHDGRTLAAITANGEIYNAGALRRELEARGHR